MGYPARRLGPSPRRRVAASGAVAAATLPAVLLAAALCAGACTGEEPNVRARLMSELGQAAERAVRPSPVPWELPVAQGGLGWAKAVAAFGGARLTVRSFYEAGVGARTAHLDSEATLEERSDGAFRVEVSLAYATPDGREGRRSRSGLWLGGRLYTRLDQQPYQVRDSLSSAELSWKAAAAGVLATLQQVLGPTLVWTAAGTSGADGQVVTLAHAALGRDPHPPLPLTALAPLRDNVQTWPRWWRGTYRLTQLSGQRTSVPPADFLRDLQLRFEAVTDAGGQDGILRVAVTALIRPLDPATPGFAPPADAVEPAREREILRTRRILKPFLPPPAPDAGSTAP